MIRLRYRRTPPRFDAAAALVQRLAVLLDAGIAPVSAWRHAAQGGASPVATAVADSAAGGHELADRLRRAAGLAPPGEREAWSTVAAAWEVATGAGAPLAPTLARLADVLRSLAQSARDVEVALAGPIATGRIVLALPFVGLGFAALLGFDALGSLFTTGAGLICLVLGVVLIAAGARWNRRLIRAASAVDPTPGLGLDLLAIAVSGGADLGRARELTEAALVESGLAPLDDDAESVLAFSRAAGVPAAALLRAESEERRRRARSGAQRQAARLGTRLLLPLGVCLLPAFVLLGVAPVVLSLVSSTAAQL